MAYNVLVVDDSAIIRKVVIKSISMTGVDLGQVHEAQDGIEALEVLAREWIDIVFADLNMPRMGGVELVEKLAEDSRLESLPVVVITSDRNDMRLAELKQRGVSALINKPFRPETLAEVMNQVLGVLEGGKHE